MNNLVAVRMGVCKFDLFESCNWTPTIRKKLTKIASTHKFFLFIVQFSLRTEFLVNFVTKKVSEDASEFSEITTNKIYRWFITFLSISISFYREPRI